MENSIKNVKINQLLFVLQVLFKRMIYHEKAIYFQVARDSMFVVTVMKVLSDVSVGTS